MPRYRITKPIPEVLPYKDGRLYFHDYYAGGKEWVWYVRREIDSSGRPMSGSADLFRAEDALQLDRMRKEGFDVKASSVAELVLRSLERHGYAERLPE